MRSTLLLVLGMHRSGTSAAAKALEALGANMGSHLMPEAADNPLGFFEDLQLQGLNEQWLAQAGLTWSSVTSSVAMASDPIALAAHRDRIQLALRERISMPRWAFKDPRMCRLFWLWKPVLAEFQIDTCAIFVLRNPFAVAQSLHRRNGMPHALGLLLWRLHNAEAFSAYQGSRGSHLFYEDLLSDPVGELTRVASAIGLDVPDRQRLRAYRNEFLSAELNHFELSDHPRELSADLGDYYAALWQRLRATPSLLSTDNPDNPFEELAPSEAQLVASCLYLERDLADVRRHAANLTHALHVSQTAHAAVSEAFDALQKAASPNLADRQPWSDRVEGEAAPAGEIRAAETDRTCIDATIVELALLKHRRRLAHLESQLYQQMIQPFKRK
jgi:hypothetical protein